MNRIIWFLITNFAVMATIYIMLNLFNVAPYLQANHMNYGSLAIFCLIVGMTGSMVSLLLSKPIAKASMGVKIIDSQSTSTTHIKLLNTVHRLARQAGLSGMPEVGIYRSPEPNAFATGASRNHALIAVSTGLLEKMNEDEITGVLGHEISHIANGDMITMMLLSGVINTFSMFFARVLAFLISNIIARSNDDSNSHTASSGVYFITSMIFDILFTLLGSLVVAAFSRWREYRADAGSAHLTGRHRMIQALERLESLFKHTVEEDTRGETLQTLKIAHRSRWQGLWATHPPIQSRIARLQQQR